MPVLVLGSLRIVKDLIFEVCAFDVHTSVLTIIFAGGQGVCAAGSARIRSTTFLMELSWNVEEGELCLLLCLRQL